jgi:hypothetical protein
VRMRDPTSSVLDDLRTAKGMAPRLLRDRAQAMGRSVVVGLRRSPRACQGP